MRRAFKYRLYPNPSQTEALQATLETHRRLYNSALEERRNRYEAERHSISYMDRSAKLREARKTDPYLAKTNLSSTQATLRRLDRAFKAFFRRVRMDEAPGYPRFKGRDRFHTVEFPCYGDGCKLKENGERLYLQHAGHIKVKLHRPIEGEIKTVLVKRSCRKWYAIFSCDLGDIPEATGEGRAIGIDLGLETCLATSDGDVIAPPRRYREAQKKLRRAQRAVARKQRGSNRRRKA